PPGVLPEELMRYYSDEPAPSTYPPPDVPFVLCQRIYDRRWQDATDIIDRGGAVNAVDAKGRTPLGCLVEQWYNWTTQDEAPGEAVLQKLLQHGADPFAPAAATLNTNDIRPPVEMVMDYPDAILAGIILT